MASSRGQPSRRDLLGYLGSGAGLLALSALTEACGVKGTAAPPGGPGRAGPGAPAWWQQQRLHHQVNFANWPIYIDTLRGQHPTLRYFTRRTGIQVSYDIIMITNNTPVWGSSKPTAG
jgi:spermidine/putrescine transport system substrate-binding protein